MASTYSTSLKFQEIGSGEQSGVWGSTTNTNLTLIEQAIAGVQTITMANSNYTLTNLNGVYCESRNMVLVLSGTNSAVYQVVAPLVSKFYVVSNQTVGGYAVTIGGATGSIVAIPNGTVGQVYCDGTNFYSAQTGSAGNFNVNGTLTAGSIVDTGPISATTITASTQFNGPATGLTGTAAALTAGNATTAATANALNTGNGYTIAGLTVTGTGVFVSPNSGSTGGVQIKQNAGGGSVYLQFVNNAANAEFADISASSSGVVNVTAAGGLTCSANFTAAGNVTAYSDERLKRNWAGLDANFIERLAQVKSGTYERIDNGNKQVGVSAQSLQTLMPEAVMTNAEGVLSVAYGNAAMAAVVELAKELVALKAEIKQLKGE